MTNEVNENMYDQPVVPASKNSFDKIQDQYKGSLTGQEVMDRVVQRMANQELERRADIVMKAVAKINQLDGDIKKSRPDVTTFDGEGKATAVYSKDAFEKLKKSKEQHAKAVQLLEKAFANNEWKNLEDQLK